MEVWGGLGMSVISIRLEIRDSQTSRSRIGCLHAASNFLIKEVKPHKVHEGEK